MADILTRLKTSIETGLIDGTLLPEAAAEIAELRKRQNEVEELLIMIVRTGWPWDEDGEPNEIFRTSRDGFSTAMSEARYLLGLDHLSKITRTEPRT